MILPTHGGELMLYQLKLAAQNERDRAVHITYNDIEQSTVADITNSVHVIKPETYQPLVLTAGAPNRLQASTRISQYTDDVYPSVVKILLWVQITPTTSAILAVSFKYHSRYHYLIGMNQGDLTLGCLS